MSVSNANGIPPAPQQALALLNDSFAGIAWRYYADSDFSNSLATTNAEVGENNSPHTGNISHTNVSAELDSFLKEKNK